MPDKPGSVRPPPLPAAALAIKAVAWPREAVVHGAEGHGMQRICSCLPCQARGVGVHVWSHHVGRAGLHDRTATAWQCQNHADLACRLSNYQQWAAFMPVMVQRPR